MYSRFHSQMYWCSIRPIGVRQGRIQDFGLGAGRASKARELRRRKRRMGVRYVEGVSPPHWGKIWVPSPQNFFFNFGVSKCILWCILWPTWTRFCCSWYFLLMLWADLLTMNDYMTITTEFTVIVVIVAMRLECVLPFRSSTTSTHFISLLSNQVKCNT